MNEDIPVVTMEGISIEFPGVKALDAVDFRLFQGEVHALMGENGAGKSTLIKALTGVYGIDSGKIVVLGRQENFTSPAQAQEARIATVYQEVNLCPNLSVEENILLGREPRRGGLIHWKAVRARATEILSRMHLDIDPGSELSSHSIAVQQLVAIARSVEVDAKVLILDEPTSSLDTGEVNQLFQVIRELRDSGVAILFVSHFLEQVYEISDRLTVLRNGALVGEYMTRSLPRLELIAKMIGKDLATLDALDEEPSAAKEATAADAVAVITAEGLGRKGRIDPFDLSIFPGEVIGLAGLLGSGRTELARLLFGAEKYDVGSLTVGGVPGKIRTPRNAINAGIAFSSEDRKAEGLIGDLSVRDNLVLAMQASRGWLRRIPRRQQDELTEKYIKALDIRPANPNSLIRNLSGGNQQKVLLARWLITSPKLLILDEPTRGIDIGAKTQIQKLVLSLAKDGMSILFISAELEEVVRLSNRIAVLRDRKKIAELINDNVSLNDLMETIAGGSPS